MKKFNIVFVLFLSTLTYSQMIPTKKQFNDLTKQRNKLIVLQTKLTQTQSKIGYEFLKMQILCKNIISTNNWPNDTQCDVQTLVFNQRQQPQQQQQSPANPNPPQSYPAPNIPKPDIQELNKNNEKK